MAAADPIDVVAAASEIRFSQEGFWQDAWVRHLEAYLAAPPRCGYWLAAMFGRERPAVLEIAGGSCRDSRLLAEQGWAARGSDFEQRTLDYLQRRYPQSRLTLERQDAFQLTLPDKSVDLTFHNGFWVLFRDDSRIQALVREQERVTRRHLVALVHNADNARLVDSFRELSLRDPLYDIRFFSRDEVAALIRSSGITYRSLTLHKFGGRMDVFFSPRVKGWPNPVRWLAPRLVPRAYAHQAWEDTERIACLVELA